MLIQKGTRLFDRGDFRAASKCYEKAATAAHASGDIDEELAALDALAVAMGSLGNPGNAEEAAMRLLTRSQQSSRDDYEMIAILRLTDALADMDLRGRWYQIQPLLLRSLATAQWLREPFYEVYCLLKLGDYAVRLGEAGEARLREAMAAIVPGMESEPWFRGEIYSALSRLKRQQEDYAEAVRFAAMALGQAQLRGRPDMMAEMQLVLAQAEAARGDRGEALRLAEEARTAANQHRWRSIQQQAERICGELERALHHAVRAEAATRRALELARELGLKQEEVDCLLDLGQVLADLRQRGGAREALDQARRLSQARGYAEQAVLCGKLLSELT
jgi:tetratricopeptide (TPR) repeat protein